MSSLLAIDPGVHASATAWFEDRALQQVGDWPACKPSPIRVYDRAVVEVPQFDGRVSLHVIGLAVAGAHLAGSAAEHVRFVTPREWKGSMPKPVHHHKVWLALSPAERTVLPDYAEHEINKALIRGAKDGWRKPGGTYYGASDRGRVHNALDAVALGLFELGRLVVV